MERTSIQLEIDASQFVMADRATMVAFEAQCQAIADEVTRRRLHMVASSKPERPDVTVITVYGPAKELLQIRESHERRGK